MCRWSTFTFESSCGYIALDTLEWREMTEQIDWRAKQPSQMARFSEDLKCWEACVTTCGHKAKDITPINHMEERGMENGSSRRSYLKRTGEGHCKSDKHWNRFKSNFGEKSERRGGAHNNGLFRADKYHLELNWTELTWYFSSLFIYFAIYLHVVFCPSK